MLFLFCSFLEILGHCVKIVHVILLRVVVILVTTSNLFKVLVARDLSHEPRRSLASTTPMNEKTFDVGLVSQDHTCAMNYTNGSRSWPSCILCVLNR